jgi:predicted transcriptional regulator
MKPKVKNWLNQLNNGIIQSNTTKIIYQIHYHTFKVKGYTNVDELRTELNIPHQTLTAILSSIQDEGLVKSWGEVKIGETCFQKLSYARPEEREDLVKARRKEKLTQWIKRGKEEFNDLLPNALTNELNKLC